MENDKQHSKSPKSKENKDAKISPKDKLEQIKGTPGPGKYYPNVYEYPEKKEDLLEIFNHNGGTTKKMFINKVGYLFPPRDKKKEEKNAEVDKAKTYTKFPMLNREMKKSNSSADNRLNEVLQTNKPGYTLGIKKGNYDFKSQRKKEYKSRAEELEKALIEDQLTLHRRKPPQLRDLDRYTKNKNENLQERKREAKEEENKINDKIKENRKKLEEEKEKKINEIKERREKYDQKIEERQKDNKDRAEKATRGKTVPRKVDDAQPDMYDIRFDYTTSKKGWSFGYFGGKPDDMQKDPFKKAYDPPFADLKSDFDKYANKTIQYKRTAPRFPEVKYENKGLEDQKRNGKTAQEELKDRRHKERYLNQQRAREKKLNEMRTKRDIYLEKVMKHKEENEENMNRKREELLRNMNARGKQRRNDFYDEDYLEEEERNYAIRDINYNLVEDRAPIVK
ncbi:MAG: hypothetical protein MJ252_26300 [archaeon]|nr:hypothetical protein [archaeon]